ncbi:MAG: hypothetical protein RR383_07320 [Muribaculaceae bacterium]
MKKLKYTILIAFSAICATSVATTNSQDEPVKVIINKQVSVLDSTDIKAQALLSSNPEDLVIVGNDTVSIIIPEFNLGRYDRGLYNFLFSPKGQWSFGLTASYGEFDVGDMKLINLLKDFDFKGSVFSIKPYVSYFFRNNQAIGMRLGYNRNKADLDGLNMDFGDDLNFNIKDVHYHSESYSASLFYRHYIGLGREKRFAIFNEVDLTFASGSGTFKRNYDSKPRETRTVTTEAQLNFSPGLCIFIHDNISFNVSFGVFGLYLKNEKQKTNNVEEGSRFSSGADFRFNLFNISFGIAVHI